MGDHHRFLGQLGEEGGDARLKIRHALAARRLKAGWIGGPGLDERAVEALPRLHLPVAKVELGQPRIDDRRLVQPFREQAAALQRAREERRAGGQQGPEHLGERRRILGERQIGGTVTEARRHGRRRVANQPQAHTSPR